MFKKYVLLIFAWATVMTLIVPSVAHAEIKFDCKEADLSKNCAITSQLLDFTNALSAVVGIICVIMIAFWGLQYIIARDNSQNTAKARMRLLQTVGALVAYLFMYAFLQYLVPGGVF